MKALTLLTLFLLITSCSSPEKKTKYSDKNMRIMVDPDSLKVKDFVRLQTELVKSDVWTVIDRGAGYKATLKEQNRLHRRKSDRFDDREKFAHWGRLFGVGAIIVGHTQCRYGTRFWGGSKKYNICYQAINLVVANTGEVVVGVDGESLANIGETPNWEETVEKLIEIYPKHFTPSKITERLNRYKEESKEHSTRQKERNQ